MSKQYDGIFYNQSRANGQMRMSENGLGWRSTVQGAEPVLIAASELQNAQWSRGGRGWMLKVYTNTLGPLQFDGFEADDLKPLKNALSSSLGVELEVEEHSTRGWNWGQTELGNNELVFNVGTKPAFELPYKAVANANVVGKSEVALEVAIETGERVTAGDELVEVRFYVPGIVEGEIDEEGKVEAKDEAKGEVKHEQDEDKMVDEEDAKAEEDVVVGFNAADVFCQDLKNAAGLGLVRGDELLAIEDVLLLTPRGRYNLTLCGESFRLRGKSYDYNVRYTTIQRLFVLPKADDANNLVILQLEPPLMQGQTRYPFLVMQFAREDNLAVNINVEDEQFEKTYAGRIEKSYDEPGFRVISNLFKGLSQRKITFTGSYVSANNYPSVECTYKAAGGSLYILEKAFLFVSRAPVYIPFADVSKVIISRIGAAALASARTFDLTVTLADKKGSFVFLGIEKEEQVAIETYITSKNIRVQNEFLAEKKRQEAAEQALNELDSDEDDDDFAADPESDIADEFDSDVSDSEALSDDDLSDAPKSSAVERSSSKRASKRSKDV